MYLKVLIKALESRDKMKKEHKELLDSFWGTDLFAELIQDNCVGYEFTYKTDDVNKFVYKRRIYYYRYNRWIKTTQRYTRLYYQ